MRRYATQLTDLDVPVRSLRGRYGGYRLAPGFRFPPLMFTDEEAVAVLFGLVTAPHRTRNYFARVQLSSTSRSAAGT